MSHEWILTYDIQNIQQKKKKKKHMILRTLIYFNNFHMHGPTSSDVYIFITNNGALMTLVNSFSWERLQIQ